MDTAGPRDALKEGDVARPVPSAHVGSGAQTRDRARPGRARARERIGQARAGHDGNMPRTVQGQAQDRMGQDG